MPPHSDLSVGCRDTLGGRPYPVTTRGFAHPAVRSDDEAGADWPSQRSFFPGERAKGNFAKVRETCSYQSYILCNVYYVSSM